MAVKGKRAKKKPTLAQWEKAAQEIGSKTPHDLSEFVSALTEAIQTPPLIVSLSIDRKTGSFEVTSNVRPGADGLADMLLAVVKLKETVTATETQAKELEIDIRVTEKLAEAETETDDEQTPADDPDDPDIEENKNGESKS